ncbi:MAG: hypothetical protein Q8Q03_01990 [bacterium]|nr:hypothetical protein [bacterium]
MNDWDKHEIAKKYQAGLLNASSQPYLLEFVAPPVTPGLDHAVESWRDAGNNPFPANDLISNKVGVFDYDEERNTIACFPISWGQKITMTLPHIRPKLPPNESFYYLSVCGIVRTIDNHLLLSCRSKAVNNYQGMWHASIAGTLDIATAKSSRTVFPQFFQEMEEELQIYPSHIIKVNQLGLCKYLIPNSASFEVCMSAQVSLTAKEVLERAKDAKDSWEGTIHAFTPEEATRMLSLESKERFVPGGAATLILKLGL